jgi:large subunit ribosomal protein L25
MHENDTLSVSADATRLPEHLEASIEGLTPGSRVTAADVKLPEGVTLVADPELVVAMVNAAPTAEDLEGEVEAPEGEAAEGEEGAEGEGAEAADQSAEQPAQA